jgi:hypothetical protein
MFMFVFMYHIATSAIPDKLNFLSFFAPPFKATATAGSQATPRGDAPIYFYNGSNVFWL